MLFNHTESPWKPSWFLAIRSAYASIKASQFSPPREEGLRLPIPVRLARDLDDLILPQMS